MGCSVSAERAGEPDSPNNDVSWSPASSSVPPPALATRMARGIGKLRRAKSKEAFGLDGATMVQGRFQMLVNGYFQDYRRQEDAILKRAFLIGRPSARLQLRGQAYEYSFVRMTQRNLATGRLRKIRPPFGMAAPPRPILPLGPMTVVCVPANNAGSVEVSDMRDNGQAQIIRAVVPEGALPGDQMAVPLPRGGESLQALAYRQARWLASERQDVPPAVACGLAVGGAIVGAHLTFTAALRGTTLELSQVSSWIGCAYLDEAFVMEVF